MVDELDANDRVTGMNIRIYNDNKGDTEQLIMEIAYKYNNFHRLYIDDTLDDVDENIHGLL